MHQPLETANDRLDVAKFLVKQGSDMGSALLQAVVKQWTYKLFFF